MRATLLILLAIVFSKFSAFSQDKDKIYGFSLGANAYIPGTGYSFKGDINKTTFNSTAQAVSKEIYSSLKLWYGFSGQARFTWKVYQENGIKVRFIAPKIEVGHSQYRAENFTSRGSTWDVTNATIHESHMYILPSLGVMLSKTVNDMEYGLDLSLGYTQISNQLSGVFVPMVDESRPYLTSWVYGGDLQSQSHYTKLQTLLYGKWKRIGLQFGFNWVTIRATDERYNHIDRNAILLNVGATFNLAKS